MTSSTFRYEALTPAGQLLNGTIAAPSEAAGRAQLEGLAVQVRRFEPITPPRTGPLNAGDLTAFNEQLAHLARAGLPVEHGLRLLGMDLSRGRLRDAIQAVTRELDAGRTLPEALAAHRRAFPPLYAEIVEGGIRTGNLPGVLFNLSRHLGLSQRIRSAVSRAVAYPVMVMLAIVVLAAYLSAYVLPTLANMFHDKDFYFGWWRGRRNTPTQPLLPWTTDLALAFGQIAPYLALGAIVIVVAWIVLWPILRTTSAGIAFGDRVILRLPLIGKPLRFNLVGRWCDALRIGVLAGLDLPAAIGLASQTVGSPPVADGLRLQEVVARGGALASAAPLEILPMAVPATIDAAINAGTLPDTLGTIAALYLRQAETRTRLIPLVLTPILVLVLALTIALLLAAMFNPITRMIERDQRLSGGVTMSTQTTLDYPQPSVDRPGSELRRWWNTISRTFTHATTGLILLVIFVGLSQTFGLGPVTAIPGAIAALAVTTVAAQCVRAARARKAQVLLSYIEQGIRLQLPLPAFLRVVSTNESGNMARRLVAIADSIEASLPLADALMFDARDLSPRVVNLIRAAERNGTLEQTLARLIGSRSSPLDDVSTGGFGEIDGDEPSARTSAGAMAYLAAYLVILSLVGFLIAVFVMPKLSAIMHDFGLKPPPNWQYFDRLAPIATAMLLLPLVVGVVLLLMLLARNARLLFFPTRRQPDERPLRALIDELKWATPIIGSSIRDRDYADVCQSLADGLSAGRPLNLTLADAAGSHLNAVTLRRLKFWQTRVDRGEPAATAAQAAGLPSLLSGLMGDGAHAGDAMAFLAEHYRLRMSRRTEWIAAAVVPVMTLISGAVVMWMALLLWRPLGLILDATAPYKVSL